MGKIGQLPRASSFDGPHRAGAATMFYPPPSTRQIISEYIKNIFSNFFGLRYCNFPIITPDNSEKKNQTQKHVALQLPII
jgi:hypothetical protein